MCVPLYYILYFPILHYIYVRYILIDISIALFMEGLPVQLCQLEERARKQGISCYVWIPVHAHEY